MQKLIVVSSLDDWDLDVPGTDVVLARDYLTDPKFQKLPRVRVFNLARSYRYQKTGYYVSLLADARGHRPFPDVETIQDLKTRGVIRLLGDELDELIQSSLKSIQSPEFLLSVYFGRNMAKRHDRLSHALFQQFSAPLLRARFTRSEDGEWSLVGLDPMGAGDVPDSHRPFLNGVAREFFESRRPPRARKNSSGYDLAILVDPEETEPPSNERAIRRFISAGESVGLGVEVLGPDDLGRIGEFDALFLRETTSVNHRTYRVARQAEARGMVVVDDPVSILRCTNKVFLAECLERARVPAPRTIIVHRNNVDAVIPAVGLPAILKQPDSAFSKGVGKVETEEELRSEIARLLERSDLVIAQAFLPTDFDWRIGIFDGHPIYACRYFMADKHWQIYLRDDQGKLADNGRAETLPVEHVPTSVLKAASKAAALMGKGLYGVDLKEADGKAYVIEVNDNPNIDAGFEDAVLKDELYLRIMRVFLERIRRGKEANL